MMAALMFGIHVTQYDDHHFILLGKYKNEMRRAASQIYYEVWF
jgi:hypothetical protein